MKTKNKGSFTAECYESFNVGSIIFIIINIIILYYVFKLDHNICICSNNWRKIYIQIHSITMCLIYILIPFLCKYINNTCIPLILMLIVIISNIFSIYVIWSYLDIINNCECAKIDYLKYLFAFIKYYNYFQIILFIIIIIQIINMVIMIYNYNNTNY